MRHQLQAILSEHKQKITEEWVSAIFGTYEIDTVGFLRSQDNAFANPVGNKTKKATAILIDALVDDNLDSDVVTPAVNELIQVRAIQKFEADQAMSVLFV
jgi:RsbRD-like negative regulator of sigma factor